MSNRILAFIILIGFFGLIIGGYLYLFVFYGGNLQVKGNVSEINISLTTDVVSQAQNFTCPETSCIFEDIPPLEYTIVISKVGYENFISYKKIPGKGTLLLEYQLEKKAELTNVSEVEVQDTATLTSQKVTRLKYRNFYSHYDFLDDGVFYIREYLGKLFLYHDIGEKERLIYDFEKVSRDEIHISPIYGTDYYNISVDGANYLFDIDSTAFRGIDLKQKILYGKGGGNNQEIIFTTEVGSYIYDLKNRNSEYYVPFADFVYLDNGDILGLIKADDERRIDNYGVSMQGRGGLFRYNTTTKEMKKVFTINETFEAFYLDEGELYMNIGGVQKILQNY